MSSSRAALIMTSALALVSATACPSNGDKKSKDAGAGPDLPVAIKDLKAGKEAGGKDLAVDVKPDLPPPKDIALDVKPDKTYNPDLPVSKDLYNLNGDWMPCYGLTGYDNTCVNIKTGFKCCRGKQYPPGANSCPPGLQCGHYDCFYTPDGGIYSKPCPVGSYCVSPSGCWCVKSTGACGACNYCSKTCNLLPQCPVQP